MDDSRPRETGSGFPLSFSSFLRTSSLATTTTLPSTFSFLPDFTEHPKPQRRRSLQQQEEQKRRQSSSPPPNDRDSSLPPPSPNEDIGDGEVTFFQDFIAGGMAGSASIIVGHPFDTIKVRVQSSSGGIFSSLAEFGGISSLFRGMGAPLSAAAFINAVIFSSYGAASKLYDQYVPEPEYDENDSSAPTMNHDPPQKAMLCGAFAGTVQCFIICPMEHVKCRLQVQHGKGTADNMYKGPAQAVRSIVKEHGVSRLFQGWWVTLWREIPAFGLYFVTYDLIKDRVNTFFSKRAAAAGNLQNINYNNDTAGLGHSHTWLASAIAGGCAGCFTWAIVYPLDMIKTRIQTAPLIAPRSELQMWNIGRAIVQQHGWRYLFRGFGVTLLRAFPVNGTVFPVYEFTLLQMKRLQLD